MSSSTLDPENSFERDRQLGKGHGTGALGPSDSSDSGSDVTAGNAGNAFGNIELDSDTDAEGTGERASAGRNETSTAAQDIGVDRIVRLNAHGNLVPDNDNSEDDAGTLDLNQLALGLPLPDET